MDALNIIDENGVLQTSIHANTLGVVSLGYPQWADDGKRIVLTYWNSWGTRGLAVLTFSSSTVR